MNRAIIVEEWKFHMIDGTLYITKEDDADVQVKLSPDALLELLKYISACSEDDSKQASKR